MYWFALIVGSSPAALRLNMLVMGKSAFIALLVLSTWGLSPAQGMKFKCDYCGKHSVGAKRCSACRSVRYCCKEHQQADWPRHKPACRAWQGLTGPVAHEDLLLAEGAQPSGAQPSDDASGAQPSDDASGAQPSEGPGDTALTREFLQTFRDIYLRNPDEALFREAVEQMNMVEAPDSIDYLLHTLTYLQLQRTLTSHFGRGSAQRPIFSEVQRIMRTLMDPGAEPSARNFALMQVLSLQCKPGQIRWLLGLPQCQHGRHRSAAALRMRSFVLQGLSPEDIWEEEFEGDTEQLQCWLDAFEEGYE